MLVRSSASPEIRILVSRITAGLSLVGLVVLLLALTPLPDARAFTQSGVGTFISNTVPMGHEWITRLAALELLGGDPVVVPDPNDPRRNWTQGRAKNLDLSSAQAEVQRIKSQRLDKSEVRYQSAYKWVYHAIVGERWVDIGGFNVTGDKVHFECWDAVAQEPAEVQYDHFMRRYDESGGEGGVQAARRSRERFIQYFVSAAMAPPGVMTVWDGGGYSVKVEVDRNYFLFGRAAHLFEDSFSSDHTVRLAQDNPEKVRQVKSYLCAPGSEQHTHSSLKDEIATYRAGDVIWKPGTGLDPSWKSYKPSNMKDLALVATEATKDLWAAFIRTMATPREHREGKARAEAETLARNWLSTNDAEVRDWYKNASRRDRTYVLAAGESGTGQSMTDCMKGTGVKSGDQLARVRELEATQKICLFNVVSRDGYADLFDPSLRIPYNWEWSNKLKFEMPPPNFKVSDRDRPGDTGRRMRIKCPNGKYMVADAQGWIYCRDGAPLEFVQVGSDANALYRVRYNPDHFMSYRGTSGAVGLYNSPREANFRLVHSAGHTTIESLRWKQYMWLSKESPYITHKGNPKNREAQWVVEFVP